MKALIIASVASMIDQFNSNNIAILQKLGYEVHVACNFLKGSSSSLKRVSFLQKHLDDIGVKYYQIDFDRNVLNLPKNYKSLKQVRALLKNGYDIIHCHSPIVGVIVRYAARKYRKKGTKVVYTAHGFHFYKGAPKKNWLLYYPMEKICSKWTDTLITINKEDYSIAKQKFNAKEVLYVPGIGVDSKLIDSIKLDVDKKKKELELPVDSKVVLSIGELNKNKNHETVIEALSQINSSNVYYLIAGQGVLKEYLLDLAKNKNVNLKLLGFREDVFELYKVADVFVHPSFREGLPVSVMEALMSGVPVVASNIRGCKDLVNDKNGILVSPDNPGEFASSISSILNKEVKIEKTNMDEYSSEAISKVLFAFYSSLHKVEGNNVQ